MSKLFASHHVNFNYSQSFYPRRLIDRLLYNLAWPCVGLSTLRFLLISTVKNDPKLLKLLSDPLLFMGDAGFWFILVIFLWTLTATINRYFFYRSTYTIKMQHWIEPLNILQDYDQIKDDHLKFVIKMLRIGLNCNRYTGIFAGFIINIPLMVNLPIGYLPLTLFNALMTSLNAYIAASWIYNFAFTLGFYLYYCGNRCEKLINAFKRSYLVTPIYVHDRHEICIERRQSCLLQIFINEVIKLCREIDQSEYFWYPVNNTIFMGTFIAETLLLYLMFFANVTEPIMIALVYIGGSMTIFYGQLINLIPAIYLQNKFNLSTTNIRRFLYVHKRINPMVKIRSLTVLDYLVDRHLFYVFWCVQVSWWSYLKIQIEVVSLLLLLLANIRRSKL